jgi:hypothetical protein
MSDAGYFVLGEASSPLTYPFFNAQVKLRRHHRLARMGL